MRRISTQISTHRKSNLLNRKYSSTAYCLLGRIPLKRLKHTEYTKKVMFPKEKGIYNKDVSKSSSNTNTIDSNGKTIT